MLAIYRRELKAYFHSFIGLLFIAVTLFFVGIYFVIFNLINAYPYFSYAVSNCSFLFMISIPILTMRILAEERKNKTDQLILTAPVSVGGIVMGKFLALTTILAIPIAAISTYPLIMTKFGNTAMGENYVAILAFFLYGVCGIAIGMLASAWTESQVIAAVLGFVLLFLGSMMSAFTNILSTTGNWLTKILNCFDLYTPFTEMMSGSLNLRSIIYFLSLTALVLFLTAQLIQKRRYTVSVKNLSLGAYSTGMIAVAVAIVVILNVVVSEMPVSWTTVDLSAEKLYSLTDQSKEYVKNMEEDVTIYVLVDKDQEDSVLAHTLVAFDDLSDHITVEYVNPTLNPKFYAQYTDTSVSANSLIVVSDKRNRVVSYSDVYATSYELDQTTGGYTSHTTGYDGEGQIMSALDFVLSDDMPKVYITEGHDEIYMTMLFTEGLQKGNIDFERVNLIEYETIPEDAACVLINAPTVDFNTDDIDKLIAYMEQGGKVVLVEGYTENELPNLTRLTDYMGLTLVKGMIVEQDETLYYRNPYYLLPDQEYSAYTSNTYINDYVFAPYSQGLIVDNEEAEGMSYKIFMSTSDKAFAKSSMADLEDFSRGENDVDGPFAIGVEAVKTFDDGTEAVMVVYGCEQIFTDEANDMVSGTNLTLFTNTISSFVNQEVSAIVPPKSYTLSYLMVTQGSVILLGFLTIFLLPVSCLVAGFVIWFKRRKR